MTLSEMRQALAAAQLRLTKALGQTFLHDANQLRRIVAAAELQPNDSVLEIGPGLGPLTELLVARAGRVLAIEKDARLLRLLQARLGRVRNLELIQADALEYVRQGPADWSGWKLVANLPYSVASALLVELASLRQGPERMVVTVQLEVAQRLRAAPGQPQYGLLSLLVQLSYQTTAWFKIPATCFFPRPKVDSACVTLLRRPQPLLEPAQAESFRRLVKRAFAQRRKTMLKLLQSQWPQTDWSEAFAAVGLSPKVRAEAVSLEQFAALARWMGPLQ